MPVSRLIRKQCLFPMKSALKNPCPNIIDIEASGFGFNSYPIEIGIVLSSNEKYCSLIKPEPVWTHWDVAAEKIHGLSRDELFRYGKSALEVAQQLNLILANKIIYCDGWVVDKAWLSHLFYTTKIVQQFSISPIESILSEYQMQHWQVTKAAVIDDLKGTRHRASCDALIIQETYKRTHLEEVL
ncbi:MAG: hypothetical protein WC782_10665 [Methylococcaceae bacterium]